MQRCRLPEPEQFPNDGDDELVHEIHGGRNKRAKIIEQLKGERDRLRVSLFIFE